MENKVLTQDTDCYKLAEMARKAGVSASTVYDYLRYGLLQPPVKISPTKSYFTNQHLERLYEIRNLRGVGKSINEIRDHLGCSDLSLSGSNDSIKTEIIDKALELFSRNHYEKTKVVDITNALNIGSGTFYRYFKSKEELFLGCLERLPLVLVPEDAWHQVEKESDFILRLKKRGYAMLNAFPSYIGILNYAKHSLGGDDEILAKKAAECIQTLINPLKKDLEKAVSQGRVRKDIDVDLCAHLLLGINETFGYKTLIEPEYSIEHGFGVIEDFVNHALAVRSESSTAVNTCSCSLVDISGNQIALESIRFNQSPDSLTGKYMNGELKLDFDDISAIEILKKGGAVTASIMSTSSTNVEVELNGKDVITGNAHFGLFSINIENVRSIGNITTTAG